MVINIADLAKDTGASAIGCCCRIDLVAIADACELLVNQKALAPPTSLAAAFGSVRRDRQYLITPYSGPFLSRNRRLNLQFHQPHQIFNCCFDAYAGDQTASNNQAYSETHSFVPLFLEMTASAYWDLFVPPVCFSHQQTDRAASA